MCCEKILVYNIENTSSVPRGGVNSRKIKNIREWVSTTFAYSTVLTPNSQRRRSKWIFLHLVQALKIFLISLSPLSVFLTGLWAAYILAVSSSFLLTLSTLGKHAGFSISSEEYVVGLRWINAFTHIVWSMLFGVHSFFLFYQPRELLMHSDRKILAFTNTRFGSFIILEFFLFCFFKIPEERNPQSHMTERKGCWVTDMRVWVHSPWGFDWGEGGQGVSALCLWPGPR